MSAGYEVADLALLRDEHEVEIETSAAEEGPIHRTIIWVVVDDQDRVLIRSSRGPGARRFREITARPEGRVHVRGQACRSVAFLRPMPTVWPPARRASCESTRVYMPRAAWPAITWRQRSSSSRAEVQPRPVAERMRSSSITKISRSMVRIM